MEGYQQDAALIALQAQINLLRKDMIANLRDFYATSALAILANPNVNINSVDAATIARTAYAVADEMMKAKNENT